MTSITTINAKSVIGNEVTPAVDGKTLGEHLLVGRKWRAGIVIDVSDLAPEDLVSSFVNSLLHTLQAAGIQVASLAKTSWRARFPSEEARLSEFVKFYVEDSIDVRPPPPVRNRRRGQVECE